MAISPTRFSRISVGFLDSVKSIVDRDPADTGAVFSVTGPAAITGVLTQTGNQNITGALTVSSTASIGGALTQDGAATFLSTATFAGNVTATSGIFVGAATAANEVVAISSVTAAISLGAIAAHESSSVVTFPFSGLTRGDTIIVTVDPVYAITAANRDISFFASSSSTAGEGQIWGVNSTATSVTPTASTLFRFTRINHPSYI